MVATRRRHVLGLASALVLTLLPAGCLRSPLDGGDATTGEGGAAKEQAYYLATAVGLESLAWGVKHSRGPGGAGETSTETYATTRKCEFGGAIESSGEITAQTDVDPARAIVDLQSTDVHDGCVLLVGSRRVTVTGSPSVTSTVHAASRAGQLWGAQSVTLQGTFAWAEEDGSGGRCKVNVRIDVVGTLQTTVGDVCGYHVNVSIGGN